MKNRPWVLVVDYDEAVRELISFALEGEGFGITTADGGRAALRLLASGWRPDCILMDLQTAQPDVFAFRRLYAAPEVARIPVIALTAYPGKDAEMRARALDIRSVVKKPVDLGALLRALVEAIGLRA